MAGTLSTCTSRRRASDRASSSPSADSRKPQKTSLPSKPSGRGAQYTIRLPRPGSVTSPNANAPRWSSVSASRQSFRLTASSEVFSSSIQS